MATEAAIESHPANERPALTLLALARRSGEAELADPRSIADEPLKAGLAGLAGQDLAGRDVMGAGQWSRSSLIW